jgi:hypothetical protein
MLVACDARKLREALGARRLLEAVNGDSSCRLSARNGQMLDPLTVGQPVDVRAIAGI